VEAVYIGVVLGMGTRVAPRYPGTRSGPRYPVIFITRLLSTQYMPLWVRIWCNLQRISQKFDVNLHATAIMTVRLAQSFL